MALLQPKLSLKVSQRQVLTPGLMQMVSVLALNKLELKEMIDAEMVENPVLEEIDESVPMLDEVAGRIERRSGWSGRASSTSSTRAYRRAGDSAQGSFQRDRFRFVFPGLSRPRLSHPAGVSKRAKSPRSRTFSPSLRLFPITWRGSWEL